MRAVFLLSAIVVSACQSSTAKVPHASHSTPSRAPHGVDAARPSVSRAEIASCTLGPAHLVAQNRRRPEVVVGRGHVAVAHRSRTRVSIVEHLCDPARAVHTGIFPLGASGLAPMPVKAPCTGHEQFIADYGMSDGYADDATVHADVARIEGDVYTARCDSVPRRSAGGARAPGTRAGVRCAIEALGGGPSEHIIMLNNVGELIVGARFGFSTWRTGESQVFGLALANTTFADGVYALVVNSSGRFQTASLGHPPRGLDIDDPHRFAMTMTESADGGFVFEHGDAGSTRRVRAALSPTGAHLAPPESVTIAPPAPAEVGIVSERRSSHLRLYRTGVAVPIEGIGETDATRDADFVRVGQRILVAFSEGSGDATRIRAAVVDPVTARVVGAIVEVSTAGHQAGAATIDAFGGNAVIAWDEKVDGTWEVRIAELDCALR